MEDEKIQSDSNEASAFFRFRDAISQRRLKEYFSILFILALYMLGYDLLSYYVSQVHPDFDFYPLTTILLYLTLFYLSAVVSLVLFFLLYVFYYSIKHFKQRPFLRPLFQGFREKYLTSMQCYRMLYFFFLIPLFFAFVGLYKQLIPFVNPFSWDQTFMHWDEVLHFHHQPWVLLQPLLGYPLITGLLAKIYGFWFTMLVAIMVWQANTKVQTYRIQFFLTFFLSWMILGTLLAYYFSSAGPCFYGIYSHDIHDPYTPLMTYLSDHGPAWVIDLQESLLSHLTTGTLIFAGGVSAMPSMHLSMATLCVLICRTQGKWLGRLALLFLFFIFLGSILLAWHYAVDGYIAILGTTLIWWLVGKALRGGVIDKISG